MPGSMWNGPFNSGFAPAEWRAMWAILIAELRKTHRSTTMRVYAPTMMATVCVSMLSLSHWHGVASGWLPIMANIAPRTALSWYGMPVLCAALAAVVLLAALADSGTRRVDPLAVVLHSRPFANASMQIGRLLACVAACWWPVAAALAVVQGVGAIGEAFGKTWGGTMQTAVLAAYLLLDLPAALALFGGAAMLLAALLRHRTAAAIGGLGLVALYAWALWRTPSHLLPAVRLATGFGDLASDLLPNVRVETFLHRAGALVAAAGLVVASAAAHARLTGRRHPALIAGAALALVGLAAPAGSAWHALSQQALRDRWRAAHTDAASLPAADATVERLTGLVRIAPGGDLQLDLTLGVRVAPSGDAPLRFSLNPGMEVVELRLGDAVPSYAHEHGLLTVARRAGEHGELALRLRARGAPASDFAYLESAVDWRDLPAWHPLPQLGKDAAINHRRFVALLPAARWLPVPGVAVGDADRQPLAVDLTVQAPAGWLVAGPGRRQRDDDRHRFFATAPLADIAIVAAPFARYATTVAGVEVELLAHPRHVEGLARLAVGEPLRERLGELFNAMNEHGLPYPHGGFTAVEVPTGLRLYGGGWRMDSLALPGLLLLSEASLATPRFAAAAPATLSAPERFGVVEFFFTNDSAGNDPRVALARQVFRLRAAAAGSEKLALGFVMNDLAARLLTGGSDGASALHFAAAVARQCANLRRLVVDAFGSGWGPASALAWATLPPSWWRLPLDDERVAEAAWNAADVALAELDCRPAGAKRRTAQDTPVATGAWRCGDPPHTAQALDPLGALAVLRLKGAAAVDATLDTVGRQGAAALLAEIASAGGVYRLGDVAAAGDRAGVAIRPLLDDWLAAPGLPGLLASSAQVARLPDDDAGAARYQIRVHVRNDEATPGMLRLMASGVLRAPPGHPGAFPPALSRPLRIGPNAAVEIGLVSPFPPASVTVVPYLARNRGPLRLAVREWESRSADAAAGRVAAGPFSGAAPSDWRPAPTTGIVVDDLDADFAIAPADAAAGRRIATSTWLPSYPPEDSEPRWSRQTWPTAWGKYRRTVARTLAGAGERAVFAAHLPTAGHWRLQYHWPTWPKAAPAVPPAAEPAAAAMAARMRQYHDEQRRYRMLVVAEDRTMPVAFNAAGAQPGWNDLGEFQLTAGAARLVVSGETAGASVIADAIRWLHADGPSPAATERPPAQ